MSRSAPGAKRDILRLLGHQAVEPAGLAHDDLAIVVAPAQLVIQEHPVKYVDVSYSLPFTRLSVPDFSIPAITKAKTQVKV